MLIFDDAERKTCRAAANTTSAPATPANEISISRLRYENETLITVVASSFHKCASSPILFWSASHRVLTGSKSEERERLRDTSQITGTAISTVTAKRIQLLIVIPT